MTGATPSIAGDLFPGFADHELNVGAVRIFARVGGAGPPLLLLHGYPQTHAMWHRIAPALAEHFTLVMPDLRGYGRSSCPPTDLDHRPYSKRAMAGDVLVVMQRLGFKRFAIMGHDRGARVAHRLAIDHGSDISALVLLDIMSVFDQWHAQDKSTKLRMFHWALLAQPAPLPESLIGSDPIDWLESQLKRGMKSGTLDAIDPRAMADYVAAFSDPDHRHATCEDYRAGAHCDFADETADRKFRRLIECPTLAIWGKQSSLGGIKNLLDLWRAVCPNISGHEIDGGHYIAEENPTDLIAHTLPFLKRYQE